MTRMWTLPAIIGIALVAWIAFEGIRFAMLVRESAKLVEHSEPFERFVDGGSPRILVAGDSTAVGTGTTPDGSTAGHFGADFPNASIVNVSTNGWKIDQLLAAFPEEERFDLVVLQIGANDIIRGTPEDEFETSLGALFDEAKATSPNVVALHSGNIGLAPMFRWPVSSIMRARTLRYRAIYRRVAADRGVAYVDLYAERGDDMMRANVEKYYAADLLHLTNEGYGFWYGEIRKAMDAAGMNM